MDSLMEALWTLCAAFGGGLFGAILSTIVSWRIKETERRDRAAEALWGYQYSLAAFSASQYSGVVDGKAFLMSGDFKQIHEAFRGAYPFAGYLREPVRRELFREAAIDVPDVPPEARDFHDWLTAADSANDLAVKLEQELDRMFPLSRSKQKSKQNEREDE